MLSDAEKQAVDLVIRLRRINVLAATCGPLHQMLRQQIEGANAELPSQRHRLLLRRITRIQLQTQRLIDETRTSEDTEGERGGSEGADRQSRRV